MSAAYVLGSTHQGKSLKFSAGQKIDISVLNGVQLQYIHDVLQVAQFVLSVEQRLDLLYAALDCSRELVDILGFDDCFEVVLQDFCEVVL